jgi:methylated-DNA-protein-cysteine methyltransferase-like protein
MKNHTTKVSSERFLDLLEKRQKKKPAPSFYEKVYEIVRRIPKGKVTTYGAIAEIIGMKGSSRLVGQALNSMPPESDIPAQRVINRAGQLSAAHHFGGYEKLRWILEREGVGFKGDAVDLEKYFWKPTKK